MDMACRCAADAERTTREILGTGLTVENQATAVRRRDPEKAHRITDRHPVMHGIGMLLKDVAQARGEMARDITDALAAERVWALPTRRPSYLP
jgi:hypothetical protein